MSEDPHKDPPYLFNQCSPLQVFLKENKDFPMGKAGPSGVNCDTIELPMSSPEPSHTNNTVTSECYGLSTQRQFHCIAESINKLADNSGGLIMFSSS